MNGPALGESFKVPVEDLMAVSEVYTNTAERLIGKPVPKVGNAREEILEALSAFGIVS